MNIKHFLIFQQFWTFGLKETNRNRRNCLFGPLSCDAPGLAVVLNCPQTGDIANVSP